MNFFFRIRVIFRCFYFLNFEKLVTNRCIPWNVANIYDSTTKQNKSVDETKGHDGRFDPEQMKEAIRNVKKLIGVSRVIIITNKSSDIFAPKNHENYSSIIDLREGFRRYEKVMASYHQFLMQCYIGVYNSGCINALDSKTTSMAIDDCDTCCTGLWYVFTP